MDIMSRFDRLVARRSSVLEWRYVRVRRRLLLIERGLDWRTRWVAFETNDERVWRRVRRIAARFLHGKWCAGWLQGVRPDQAYFARCDRTTMTQEDIDSGRMIVLVGVAPLRPAEFVLLRIGQWTRLADDDD
jgi:phage tail sheath protein FI